MKKLSGLSLDIGQILSLTLGAFLVLLVVGGGVSILRYKAYRANIDDLYSVQQRTVRWIAEVGDDLSDEVSIDDKTSSDAEFQQIMTTLDVLAKKSFRSISQEAFFLKGMIYHANKDATQSALFFERAYKKGRSSLLGNKAALNAAAAYENIDNPKAARVLYAQVAKQKKFSHFSQEATFQLARVTESIDKVAALEVYRKLIDKVEDGNFWRALAENRSLILETQM